MKKIVLILAMLNLIFVCSGQEKQDTIKEVYNSIDVERLPEFPGGETKMYKFINDNIKYPKDAMDNNIQGKVYLKFIVEITGKITNIEIVKSVCPSIDEEAKRVVKMFPDWIPGKQNGKLVRVQLMLPFIFKLQ